MIPLKTEIQEFQGTLIPSPSVPLLRFKFALVPEVEGAPQKLRICLAYLHVLSEHQRNGPAIKFIEANIGIVSGMG
jgi:hypothetical protein